MAHSFQLVFRDCNYPSIAFWYIGAHGVLFFILFSGFYRREYYGKKPKKVGVAPSQRATRTRPAVDWSGLAVDWPTAVDRAGLDCAAVNRTGLHRTGPRWTTQRVI